MAVFARKKLLASVKGVLNDGPAAMLQSTVGALDIRPQMLAGGAQCTLLTNCGPLGGTQRAPLNGTYPYHRSGCGFWGFWGHLL
mmetsp:Transcript_40117/g.66867  ORF Transcript_40117/g.66867 Transcript_40117/m.66867 type:complete len:84 (-) Transcript_40117:1106-1357(-)